MCRNFKHQNVVGLLGVVVAKPPEMIVMEMMRGCLLDHLQQGSFTATCAWGFGRGGKAFQQRLCVYLRLCAILAGMRKRHRSFPPFIFAPQFVVPSAHLYPLHPTLLSGSMWSRRCSCRPAWSMYTTRASCTATLP